MSIRARFARVQIPVLGLVVAIVLSLLGQLPASAVAATPTGLSPAGSAVSSTPVLEWDRVASATSYRVQVSANSAFSPLLWEDTTVNRRIVPNRQLPAGEIFWRVRAADSTGTGAWATTSFTRSGVAGPTLMSPADGAKLPQPTNAALLSWTPVNGATGYTIEIDDANDFIGATTYTTKTSSYVVPNPQIKTTYYWRVRATLASGIFSQWAEPRTYEILGLAKPTNPVPADNENLAIEDVVLDWAPVPGAKSYQIRVSTDGNFLTLDGGFSASTKASRYSPATTLDNDQYYWQVRPVDALGNTPDWTLMDTWEFQRHWPDQATLQYPNDGATISDPVLYQWTPIEHASSYQVQLSTTANFSTVYDSCSTVHTTFIPTVDGACWPTANATTYWRVKGYDAPRNPPVITDVIAAPIRSFYYAPDLVELTSPLSGSVQVPTFRWQPIAGAETYRVRAYRFSDGVEVVDKTTHATSYTPTSKLAVGTDYRWQVQSISVSGRTSPAVDSADQPVFSVVAEDEAVATTPTLLTPTNGATSARMPSMSWAPVTNATSYRLYLRPAGQVWPDDGSETATTAYPAHTLASLYAEGNYDWYVAAYNGSDRLSDTKSTFGQFTVYRDRTVTGQHISVTGMGLQNASTSCFNALADPPSPTNGRCADMAQTPAFAWDADPQAARYMLTFSRDREMTNQIATYYTESNYWMPTATFIDSQAGSAYFWIVQACNPSCSGVPYATHAFNKMSNPVETISPSTGATVTNDVTFTWRGWAATNADPAFKDPTTGVNPQLEARTYRVQVATDPNFQDVIDTAEVDQMTYTAANMTYPEGPLYWRVQAYDGSDNPMTWSPTVAITKSSPVTTLSSPVNGQSVGTTEPFRWNPLSFAGSYDIEVYKNGDTIGNTANRVFSSNSKQVAYTTTTPLPASGSPYTWRVRRRDADNNPGAWTALTNPGASFSIVGTAPVQTSPLPGAVVAANEGLFSWAAVDGVTTYRFERRTPGATSNAETVTTPALAWAPTSKLAAGSYEWRVSSIDADGNVMASSPWRAFSVPAPPTTTPPPTTPPPTTTTDKTAPTVTKVSPAAGTKVKKDVNFKGIFSEKVKNVSGKTFILKKKGSSKKIDAKVTLSSDGKTAKLNPKKNLKSGKTYIAKLTSGITDLKGNALSTKKWKVMVK